MEELREEKGAEERMVLGIFGIKKRFANWIFKNQERGSQFLEVAPGDPSRREGIGIYRKRSKMENLILRLEGD